MTSFQASMIQHYEEVWRVKPVIRNWKKGPIDELPLDFCVLEMAPTDERAMWTYATCGMSQCADAHKVELHLFSAQQADDLVELLTVTAHYHHTGEHLGVGHVVNFGRGWRPGATCEYGLVSLPYLDGPMLENACICGKHTKCLWLIPITNSEVQFVKQNGLEAIESRFEESGLNYLDTHRLSVA